MLGWCSLALCIFLSASQFCFTVLRSSGRLASRYIFLNRSLSSPFVGYSTYDCSIICDVAIFATPGSISRRFFVFCLRFLVSGVLAWFFVCLAGYFFIFECFCCFFAVFLLSFVLFVFGISLFAISFILSVGFLYLRLAVCFLFFFFVFSRLRLACCHFPFSGLSSTMILFLCFVLGLFSLYIVLLFCHHWCIICKYYLPVSVGFYVFVLDWGVPIFQVV